MRKWIHSNHSAERRGKSVSRIFASTVPVCSAENTSVEKQASTQSQSSVGIHARSFRGDAVEISTVGDGNLTCLLQPVIRRFPRDDYVMHVALAQPSAADADKARLLLQLWN